MAVALAVCMLSLLGFPGTFGFIGKWQILNALLASGHGVLAVAIVLTSVAVGGLLSAGDHGVLHAARGPRTRRELPAMPGMVAGTIAVAVVVVLVLGVWPTPALDSAIREATSLFQASLAGVRLGAP